MNTSTRTFVLSILLLAATTPVSAAEILGFPDAAAQRALERDYRNLLSAEDQATWAGMLAGKPHHAGSPHGRANVRFLADLFAEWGYDVEVEAFEIVLPVPLERRLEMVAPRSFTAALEEDVVADDPSTAERDQVLAPYNAFSIDGDVTAELVFVNYGIPEDYEVLAQHGVDVAGKIVIARYGKSWRGIKPKLAAEHGAIGALIYSDPADDGYARGDVYPVGPYKNASGVQRGSVMDMPLYPGDVLTPGRPAVKGARRLRLENAPTLTRIPVLPIFYADAEPLLRELGGEVVPESWRGALPLTYHFGPGPAEVHLRVEFDWQTITAENVIARLEGTAMADEWIIRGNHHDGWNHGAADPVSGMVALLDEARAVAALAAEGRAPRRSVVYAAWDAEEQGLIGSTEWVEKHRDALDANAVAYLNTDGNSRGFVSLGGSHVLEAFFHELLAAVSDPQTNVSIGRRLRAGVEALGAPEDREKLEGRPYPPLLPLGSGSDYTPFLQHVGIASANLGFRGEGDGGSYHTLYDTLAHYTRFRDPGFRYGVTLADLAGRATLRLANAEVLPFRFQGLARHLEEYVAELEKLADDKRDEAARINRLLADGAYELALDPTRARIPPPLEASVPHFNFAPLKNSVGRVGTAAKALDRTLGEVDGATPNLAELNRRLFRTERRLTSPDGLPGRDWYVHQVYAPGFYTGYGVKTLPRVREAIEAEQYTDVDAQIEHTAATLDGFARYLQEIRELAAAGSAR